MSRQGDSAIFTRCKEMSTEENGGSRYITLWVILLLLIVLCLLAALAWRASPGGHVNSSSALDLFELSLDQMIEKNLTDYKYWHRANIAMQSVLIVTAILATVFAALTTKQNAEQMKNFSIFLTAITPGLTVAFATFHVRENVESFIKTNGALLQLEYDYLKAREAVIDKVKSDRAASKEVMPQGPIEIQQQFIG